MAEHPRTKWDYIYYALIAGTILSFALALLGFVGEQLGWWNDVGEAFMLVGTGAGAVLGGVTLVVGSSRFQVQRTTEAVEDNGETLGRVEGRLGSVDDRLGSVDDRLGSVDAKLGSVDEEMSQQTEVLEAIRDAL